MDPTQLADALPLDPMTQALVDAARSAYEQGGWAAVAGLALMFGVRILRMTEGGSAWWDALTTLRKRACSFGAGAGGMGIFLVSTGTELVNALVPAVICGVVSTIVAGVGHHATEKLGAKVRMTGNPKVDAALRMAFGDGMKEPHPGEPAPPEPPASEGGAPL